MKASANTRSAPAEEPLFLAQCIAGLQDFAAERLERDFNAAIRHVEEGLVVFSAAHIGKIPYANTVFQVLAAPKGGSMGKQITACADAAHWHQAARRTAVQGEKTFRLLLSDEGRLVGGNADGLIRQIERLCNLRHTPHRPDTEFWLFRRRGGQAYFCKRLTKNRITEKDLKPGTLRPELAHALCLLSEPAAGDIFLDPFAGSGAIPLARKGSPYEMMFVSDISSEKTALIKKAAGKPKKPIIIRTADALALDKIEDGFIDKVVTDPPWGLFDESIEDIPAFYQKVMKELCRVVKAGGLIIMLTGQRALAAALAREFSDRVGIEQRYDILVSGKKAAIMKWRRTHAAP